ncbi:WXG100 family type VII secretion target [Nocardia africana]|uniref:WXG100 family type VII secretion target n=1 Tax=Nocardia africana TaxID=134964 RepID=A0ABW6NB54_9NOCA
MSDFGAISYNFGGINDGGGQLHSVAQKITSELEDMERIFQTFMSENFGGAGAEAFHQVQVNWSQQSAEMSAALAQLGVKTMNAGEAMQGADILAAKIIGG